MRWFWCLLLCLRCSPSKLFRLLSLQHGHYISVNDKTDPKEMFRNISVSLLLWLVFLVCSPFEYFLCLIFFCSWFVLRDKAPGQRECDSSIDNINKCIRDIEQASLAVVSQNLPSRDDISLEVSNHPRKAPFSCIRLTSLLLVVNLCYYLTFVFCFFFLPLSYSISFWGCSFCLFCSFYDCWNQQK